MIALESVFNLSSLGVKNSQIQLFMESLKWIPILKVK